MSDVEKQIVPKLEPERRETELGLMEIKQEKKKSEEVLLGEAKTKDSEVKRVLIEDVGVGVESEGVVVGGKKFLWVWMGVFVVALVMGLLMVVGLI